MPIPVAPAVLNTPYATKPGQRGGTLIAESVGDVKEHRRLLESGGYRPEGCPLCDRFLHVHDQRARTLRDLSGSTTEELICRYRCRPCRAVWQVLPGFIARQLHRSWDVVQTAVSAPECTASEQGTLRRWRGRLASSALVLMHALLGVGARLGAVLNDVGAWCTRAEAVDALARAGLVRKESNSRIWRAGSTAQSPEFVSCKRRELRAISPPGAGLGSMPPCLAPHPP